MKEPKNLSIEQLLKQSEKNQRYWQKEVLTDYYFKELHQDIMLAIDLREEVKSDASHLNRSNVSHLKVVHAKK